MRLCLFAVIAAVVILALGGICGWTSYQRNTQLRLVYGERHVRTTESHAVGCPVWAVDGTRVFFVRDPDPGSVLSPKPGDLWQVNADGSAPTELLADSVFCISPCGNNRLLALTTGTWSNGSIALYDLLTGSLTEVPTSHHDITQATFSRLDTGKLFYCSAGSGIWTIRTDGSGETLVCASRERLFDLTPDDSLVLSDSSWGEKPAVHPSGRYLAVISHENWGDILLIDWQTGDTTDLDARPYAEGYIDEISWSPDGRHILFEASELGGTYCQPGPDESEVWSLDSVFD